MSWNQQQQLLPIFKLKETDMKGINFPTHYQRIPLLLDPLSQSETVVLITIFHFTLIESSHRHPLETASNQSLLLLPLLLFICLTFFSLLFLLHIHVLILHSLFSLPPYASFSPHPSSSFHFEVSFTSSFFFDYLTLFFFLFIPL